MSIAGPSTQCDYNLSKWFEPNLGKEGALSLSSPHQPSTSRNEPKKMWNYYILASESSQSSDEGSETAYSIQEKETDVARDTSDLDSDDYSEFIEYDIATDSNEDNQVIQFVDSNDSSSDDEIIKTTVITAVIPEGDFLLADSEDSQTAPSIDSEMSPFDYWKCAICQNKNNNPLYRYCEKCFRVRKDFFPPPPKHRKKRNRRRTKKQKKSEGNITNNGITAIGTSILSNGNHSDEGIGLNNLKYKNILAESIVCNNIALLNNKESLNHERGLKRQYESDDDIVKDTKKFCESFLADSIDLATKKEWHDDLFDLKDSVDSFSQPVFPSLDNIASVQKSFSEPSIKFSKDDLDLDSEKLHSSANESNNLSIAKVDKSVGSDSIKDKSDMCITCLVEPKSGVFVHGRIAHICCCYKCSVKVWMKTKRCPICKCKVSNVLRAFVS